MRLERQRDEHGFVSLVAEGGEVACLLESTTCFGHKGSTAGLSGRAQARLAAAYGDLCVVLLSMKPVAVTFGTSS